MRMYRMEKIGILVFSDCHVLVILITRLRIGISVAFILRVAA